MHRILGAFFLVLSLAAAVTADERAPSFVIDRGASELLLKVKKRGVLKAFAHDHDVAARVFTGSVTWDRAAPEKSSVRFRIAAKDLEVVDAEASKDDKAEMNEIMRGEKILDSAKFPEIVFESTAVVALADTKSGDRSLSVVGRLTLHGVTRSATLRVTLAEKEKEGLIEVRGEHTLIQSDHGIEPYSAGLGSIGVQDAIGVRFTIVARSGVARSGEAR